MFQVSASVLLAGFPFKEHPNVCLVIKSKSHQIPFLSRGRNFFFRSQDSSILDSPKSSVVVISFRGWPYGRSVVQTLVQTLLLVASLKVRASNATCNSPQFTILVRHSRHPRPTLAPVQLWWWLHDWSRNKLKIRTRSSQKHAFSLLGQKRRARSDRWN